MSSSITIHDVAREAGVSINTVSRALNGQTKGMRRDAAERAGIRATESRSRLPRGSGSAVYTS